MITTYEEAYKQYEQMLEDAQADFPEVDEGTLAHEMGVVLLDDTEISKEVRREFARRELGWDDDLLSRCGL